MQVMPTMHPCHAVQVMQQVLQPVQDEGQLHWVLARAVLSTVPRSLPLSGAPAFEVVLELLVWFEVVLERKDPAKSHSW